MKVTESTTTTVKLDNSSYSNVYINRSTGETELKFSDYRDNGSEFRFVFNMPIETARAVLGELEQDIENYDKYQAEQQANRAAELLAKKAEESKESED